MSRKKTDRVRHIRYLIIGAVALVVALVAVYGLLYTTGVTQGEFVEGEHYQRLDNPARQRPGAPIQVQEFFSYGCIHCRNFDPLLDDWLPTIPPDVQFSRLPVAFSASWSLLAQAYFTLEELNILADNHQRFFAQIHDRRLMFETPQELADFVDGHGTTAREFLETYNSQTVRRRMRDADAAQRAVGIAAVPTLVVAGKYVVTMDVGRKVALEVVDHLIAMERADRPVD